MTNYLTEHATENVWCTPDQDYQSTYQVARITRTLGVRREVNVEWQVLPLPNLVDTFHVYSIGQIHPRLLGLLSKQKQWTTLSSVCNSETMVINLFQNDGFQFPLHRAYLMVMGDRNLIIAIKAEALFSKRYFNPVFFKVYSNAFFSSVRANSQSTTIKVEGYQYWGNLGEQLAYQLKFKALQAKVGHVKAFCNGWLIDDFQPNRFAVGDILEYVYDSSIAKVLDFVVDDLETFGSLLDQKNKYLLHYPTMEDTIFYRDDMDIFLIKKETSGRFGGLYHHTNQEDSLRMVTHKDYSIVVPYVQGFIQSSPSWSTSVGLSVRLYLRHSGYARPLVDEHNRIKELYRLPMADVKRALLGYDSAVVNWRADTLENSWYTAIMRLPTEVTDPTMVEKAYGYNAISKLLADTPQRIVLTAADRFVELPVGLREGSTVYEYDSEGLLLGWGIHTSGLYYAPINTNCRLVEALVGLGSTLMDVAYNQTQLALDPTLSYRFYKTLQVAGVSLNKWVTAVKDVDYTLTGNSVVWILDTVSYQTAVKSDYRFLTYTFPLTAQRGVYDFTINESIPVGDGTYTTNALRLTPGRYEFWLNGHALIEDLDYYLNGNVVTLINKEYVVVGEQQVVVRCTGFCQADMTPENTLEWGFVQNGLLSKNNRYDVRDDRVMKLIVGGRMMHRDQLQFIETHPGVYLDGTVEDGRPYSIDDTIVPFRGLTVDDAYTMRGVSRLVDTAISNYLTIKNPQPTIPELVTIPERYRVYSPFAARLLYDLQSGFLWNDRMKGHYNEIDIRTWCAGYLSLLDVDPVKLGVDDNFVIIHPHDLYTVNELNVYQYTFLKRAITYYLNDKVDISHFVSINDGWL